jgi:hypothetical protein
VARGTILTAALAPDTASHACSLCVHCRQKGAFRVRRRREFAKPLRIAHSKKSENNKLNAHVGFLAGWMIMADYLLAPTLLYGFTGTWLNALVPQVPV